MLKFVTSLDPNFPIILAISASMSSLDVWSCENVADVYFFFISFFIQSELLLKKLLHVDRNLLTSIFKTLYTVILIL